MLDPRGGRIVERVNKEIKRRSRVVGIFPNNAAVIRLVGAELLDMHDGWVAGDRRYLAEGSMAKLYDLGDSEDVAAIDSDELAPRITSKAHQPAGTLPCPAA